MKEETEELEDEIGGWEKVEEGAEKQDDCRNGDDSEFLVSIFVTVALPNQKSKLHMAARDSTLLTVAVPRCRANGHSHLEAKEGLDPKMELCRRCFGLRDTDACRRLCEFRVTGAVRRCGRPCAEASEEHNRNGLRSAQT